MGTAVKIESGHAVVIVNGMRKYSLGFDAIDADGNDTLVGVVESSGSCTIYRNGMPAYHHSSINRVRISGDGSYVLYEKGGAVREYENGRIVRSL